MSNVNIDINALVEDHSDYLLSFAMSKLSDIELAKDLVQDTFISAITKIETFEQRSSLKTWLTSILNRKIIDHWRKAETRYTDPASSFFDHEGRFRHWIKRASNNADMETIETKMIAADSIDELYECIDTLPDKWKGVISAKYLDQIESEEICKEYEITPSNLWVIIHRAKILLRDCLTTKNLA